jgi:hypothetical protein
LTIRKIAGYLTGTFFAREISPGRWSDACSDYQTGQIGDRRLDNGKKIIGPRFPSSPGKICVAARQDLRRRPPKGRARRWRALHLAAFVDLHSPAGRLR